MRCSCSSTNADNSPSSEGIVPDTQRCFVGPNCFVKSPSKQKILSRQAHNGPVSRLLCNNSRFRLSSNPSSDGMFPVESQITTVVQSHQQYACTNRRPQHSPVNKFSCRSSERRRHNWPSCVGRWSMCVHMQHTSELEHHRFAE